MSPPDPSPLSPAALAHLLPEARVGAILDLRPISMGLSGAAVHAVTTTRGELVLRVHRPEADAADFARLFVVLRRAADAGVAPPIVHVDEAARAIVTTRVAGVPLPAALAEPQRRDTVIAGVVAQLAALHALDATGLETREPVAYARAQLARQRPRPGFPSWASEVAPIIDDAAAALARDPRRVPSHNDLNPGNVLWDGARAWLVDWEVAGLNHPFYDLAVLAMFLQLDDAAAHALLALQERRAIDDGERRTFAALRRIAALLVGLTFLGLVPDLALLPAAPPALGEVYAGMRAGTVDLQDPRGRAAFALALLGVAVHGA